MKMKSMFLKTLIPVCSLMLLASQSSLEANQSSLPSEAPIRAILTDQAPAPMGPYSQGVVAGPFVFICTGGIDPDTGKIGQTIEEQTRQTLKNVEAILSEVGLTLENVVKADVFLKDLNDFGGMNVVYANKFSHSVKPSRNTVEVSNMPNGALIEFSCMAYIPQ
jgi:2-iminobutanoate/2-iminopropanoate deaminase